MSNAVKVLQATLLGLLLALVLSLVGILLVVLGRAPALLADPELVRGVADVWFEAAADALTESGFAPGGANPDDPLLRERIVVVTEGINERVARRVIEALLYLDRVDDHAPIKLYLSTQGGWLDPAFAIVDTMQTIRAPVDTIAIGGCFSAGSVILVAGTGTRSAAPNAILSIHANQPEGGSELSSDRTQRERFERHFAARASLPREWFPLVGDEAYYLTPEEALQYHLIDRVESPSASAPVQ